MSDEIEVKQDSPVSEQVEAAYDNVWDNPEAVTFAQLEAVDTVGELCDDIGTLCMVYRVLVGHVRDNAMITDKHAAVKTVTDEFTSRLSGLLSEYSNDKSLFSKALEIFKEAPFKTEGGKKFHASDYAFVPDSKKPSTWKLRLTESPGSAPTVAQLGRAAAAFSHGGFRGNRVQLPGGKVASAKAKIRAAYHKLGVKTDEIPASIKESAMMVWKEDNDNYRIVASYTNAYRDDDATPEIISSEAQKEFVSRVDSGELPLPVFIHWHLKGTEYGVADWLSYDEENMVTTAVGHVLKGHEREAEILSQRTDIQTSHGMPMKSIVRDETDPTIIKQLVTVEISDLPSWAAANKLSTFEILKEESMSIPDAKKQYLIDLGYSDEEIAKIEQKNTQIKAAADEQGREHKENEEAAKPVEEKAVEPVATETPAADPVSKETTPAPVAMTAEQVAAAVAQVLDPIVASVKALSDKVTELAVKVKEVEEKESTSLNLTPTSSLAALIARNMTAIGSKEAALRKDSPLGKEGPAETKTDEPEAFMFPQNPFVSGIINDIISKKNGK